MSAGTSSSSSFVSLNDDPTPRQISAGSKMFYCRVARILSLDETGGVARICRLPEHTISLAPELCAGAGLQIGDVALIAAVRPASFGFGVIEPWTAVKVLAVERAS